jgi:hypothetical protein
VFAGGTSDEYMRCMTYDNTSDYIIAAGKTNSNNFAPAQNDHGYIFALDGSGNWIWGNFFYNVSYAVSTITGCKMSSLSSYVTVLGVSNSLPIIMLLNKADGSINTFLTIETVKSYTTTPSYVTYSGFFYEESDPLDGNPYFYVSFTMASVLQILKFQNNAALTVKYHFSYSTTGTSLPIHMYADNYATSQFYLQGQING